MGFERQFERIFAIRVDVFVASRREVGQIVRVDREPLGAQLFDGGMHVHRIPDHDGIGQQVQAASLILLFFLVFAADFAFVGDHQEPAQGMQRLAFVELGMDTAAQGLVVQIAQDKQGLDQASVFLQSTGQRVLPGIGLQFADQQRSGDPAEFERPGDPKQIIPATQDQGVVELPFEAGIQMGIAGFVAQPVELLRAEIADAG